MRCYNCGGRLSEYDFCTGCGVDVALYKKIMMAANKNYNEGLTKAGVRDLSGAITNLRQCLKLNKNHIEARNLLGLIYYEMGEVVAALSEWIISKNIRSNKNIADDYINMVQANTGRLETINQTVKKYNQALAYCHQDSQDLAIIQLKKVLSLNPKFVRAHQLLALLYIHTEDWERAKRELVKCLNIDTNNTTSLRYMREVEKMLTPDETVKTTIKKRNDEALRYQSDNEIIIQPMHVKEPKTSGGGTTILNIGIGLVLGVMVTFFLIRPAIIQQETENANVQYNQLSEQLDAKNANIAELEQQVRNLTSEKEEVQAQLQGVVGENGTLSTMESLLEAARIYIETPDDLQTIAQYLEAVSTDINIEETSEAFQSLYASLIGSIGPNLSAEYYTAGYEAYNGSLYEDAIDALSLAVTYDETNMEAWFTLGNAYRQSGDEQNAIETYDKVIELFPDTERARRANDYKEELLNE